jgi:hypothetical protein
MASDEQIIKMMRSNNEYYKMQKPTYKNDFEWCFAYDGLEIDI